MGGSESKGSDHKATLHFPEEEKPLVIQLFYRISHGKKYFTREEFRHFSHSALDLIVADRLFDFFLSGKHHQRSGHAEGEVDHHQFVNQLAFILKGGVQEQAHMFCALCSPSQPQISSESLLEFVCSMVHSYEKILAAHCREFQSWMLSHSNDNCRGLALYMIEDIFYAGDPKDKGFHQVSVPMQQTFSVEDIEAWLNKSSIFQQLFTGIFRSCFPLDETHAAEVVQFYPRIPQVRDTNWSAVSTILNLSSVLFLNACLPSVLQGEWRLIFSSSHFGSSFSLLLKHLLGKGLTLLVIKDRDGFVFGGFASQPWNLDPKFYGTDENFLFRLHPNFGIFRPTGLNKNFMYLNINTQTLPNGLGMGGQLNYFGLWIDQSFDKGCSKAEPRCTTYGSPQLSSKPDFQVDTVEVWLVGPVKKKEEDDEDEDMTEEEKQMRGKSVLDRELESKAMLELMGRPQVSEGIREEDTTQDGPEASKVISLF
ncbi:hypothetical protein C0Q70_18547 [Pomacea canaliculata]|uniref:MTOR-associated protein MEAK7 n=1 Tax=Pomacea canaliculata TaxID=400727 RepID=A0A2T7NGT6_POMCA|nr:TLD domain-containing protein 1-like [Pomacea canaliculata]PVD20393.1 hypothetical protein C0Q70_18547 [Pomacea canaliculata]